MSLAHQIAPSGIAARAIAARNGGGAQLPASYQSAKTALANCASIDECQSWADKAAALASYAKQAEDDELMKMAIRIRDRAINRAGELLKQIEPGNGKNQNIGGDAPTKVLTRKDAAEQAGMSKDQMVQAIRVANIPREEFERQVESANPPTVTMLAEQGINRKPVEPQDWLKGRDPAAFNKALHFVAAVEEYAAELRKADIDTIIANLDETQAKRLRTSIAAIDRVHDIIATRV